MVPRPSIQVVSLCTSWSLDSTGRCSSIRYTTPRSSTLTYAVPLLAVCSVPSHGLSTLAFDSVRVAPLRCFLTKRVSSTAKSSERISHTFRPSICWPLPFHSNSFVLPVILSALRFLGGFNCWVAVSLHQAFSTKKGCSEGEYSVIWLHAGPTSAAI